MIDQHPIWHLIGLGLFLTLLALHCRARKSGILIVVLWNLLGVILHETAHLLVGLLFRAAPTGFSIFPRRHGNGWQLGSVRFSRITAFNAVPVALAPLSLVPVAYLVAINWFDWFSPSLATTLGLYSAVFILLYNALPSIQDLRVAGNWRSLLLYGSLALLAVACSDWPSIQAIGRRIVSG
jgi:hypothetical protein